MSRRLIQGDVLNKVTAMRDLTHPPNPGQLLGATLFGRPLTLPEQIAEALGWDIAMRRIAPGARLREVELASRFGVSRPVIREVLRELEREGLVEIAAWRGASVTRLTREELSDLFDFQAILFGVTARLAAQRATPAELDVIAGHSAQLTKLAESGAPAEEYQIERYRTHMAVNRSTGTLHALIQKRSVINRVRHQYDLDGIQTQEQRMASAARWARLLELMRARAATDAESHAASMTLAMKAAALANFSGTEEAADGDR